MDSRTQANLSALIESTGDLIWLVDLDCRLIAFNQALRLNLLNNFGVEPKLGMRPEECLPAAGASLWLPMYARSFAEGSFSVEYPLADGRTFELAFNRIVIDGEIKGVSVFGRDVTERKKIEEALCESLASQREAEAAGALGSYVLDVPAGVFTNSELVDEIFGIDKDYDHTREGWRVLVHPDDRAMMDPYFADEVVGQGTAFNKEYRILRQTDQAVRWVLGIGRLDSDAQGRPIRMRGIIKDITARKLSEMQLRESEERYRIAFQTSLDAITVNRLHDGLLIDCNKAFLDITGYAREEVMGRSSMELDFWADHRDRDRLYEILRERSSCRHFEAQFRKKTGELRLGLMSASVIEVDSVPCVLCMTRDTSETRAAEDKIRNLVYYDPLTGLPNRRLLMERLRGTLASIPHKPRKQALLLVGIDNFKALNESLGHRIGDLLLQEAARRLNSCLGEDGPASRLSGDEFLVILEDVSENAEEASACARGTAEKILAAISQPCVLGGRTVRSTVSIGITFFGDRPSTVNDVLQQADIALDQAQTAGRNMMRFFAPALQAAVNARVALEDDLGLAIKAGEFVLHYQPQVNRGLIIGAEALIRWNHPRLGLLAPGAFIPLAEETGLILPLGEWVLETACKQIAAWCDRLATTQFAVAVNISARQFHHPEFVPKVLSIIERTGANPRYLELELTESILVEDIEDVVAKMTVLKAHGVRFSLDDFGTGYSSLAYLKRLPFDQLKIDRSFVLDIQVDAGSGTIAQAILSMSKAMGLPAIAEGVETEEQREFLVSLGCHSFQGYLFSRPLPLQEFEQLWLGCIDI